MVKSPPAYNSYNGKLNTITYGNGFAEKYVYDALDRISEIKYNTGSSGAYVTAYRYTYTSGGQLSSVEDVANGKKTYYHYNTAGLLTNIIADEDRIFGTSWPGVLTRRRKLSTILL